MASTTRRRSTRLKDEPAKNMNDDSEEEESEDSECDQENEIPKQVVVKVAPTDKDPAKKRAPAKRPPKKTAADAEILHSLGIFEIIAKHSDAILRAAKEWVQEYKADSSRATARLMSLLVQASGSDKEIEGDEIDDVDVDDLAKQLADGIIKDGGTEPFQDRKLQKLNFRTAYGAFWDGVVSELHAAELLSNSIAIEKISNLVVALSCSTVRPFRLAATVTASHLVSAFIGLQKQLSQALSAAQFQLDAEAKKKGGNKALIDGLNRQVDQHHRRFNELKDMVSSITTSIFAVRFRDLSSEIRVTTVSSVASWIEMLPDTFLVDGHLKYLGWALSDMDAPVRLAAVHGVLQLFRNPENLMALRDFKGRFLERFKELPYDKDETVAVKGLELLTQLVCVGELEHESVSGLSNFLADRSHDLRHAASALVTQLLLHSSEQRLKELQAPAAASPSASRGKKRAKGQAGAAAATAAGKKGAKNLADAEKQAMTCQLMAVLEMMENLCGSNPQGVALQATPIKQLLQQGAGKSKAMGPIPLDANVVELLVDALYERLPVLQDWSTMTSALLDDDQMEDRGRSGHIHLVLILCAAVRRVQEGSKPSATGAAAATKRGPRSKSSAPSADAHQEVTLLLITAMPSLLRKYQTDAPVIAPLLRLVRSLRLELYSLKQEEKSFAELLGLVTEQLFKYADSEEVMVEAVTTLVYAANEGPSGLQPAAQLALGGVVNKTSNQLVAAAKVVQGLSAEDLAEEVAELSAGNVQDAEQLYNLKCALQRTTLLLLKGARAAAAVPAVYDALNALLQEAHQSGRILGSATLKSAITAIYLILLWGLNKAKTDCARNEGAGSPSVTSFVCELSTRGDAFVQQLMGLHGRTDSDEDLRDTVFHALSDVVFLFGGARFKGTGLEKVTISELTDAAIRQLWSQCASILNRSASAFVFTPSDFAEAAEDDLDLGVEEEEEDEEVDDAPQSQEAGSDAVLSKETKRARLVAARRARLSAVAIISRLLASGCLSARHFRWLGINIVSNFVSFGASVSELVKQLCRRCKQVEQSDPALAGMMPVIFLGAMKVTYSAVLIAEEEEVEGRLQDFSELCKKLASMYAGHNINREDILAILRGGVSFALQEPPSHLRFLSWGLRHFVPKIPAADAASLASELEAAAAALPSPPSDEDDPEWPDYHSYLQGLKERATKTKAGGTKGVLKAPGAAKAAKTRKISFAAQDDAQPAEGQLGRRASGLEEGPSGEAAAGAAADRLPSTSPPGAPPPPQKNARSNATAAAAVARHGVLQPSDAGSLQHTNSSLPPEGGELRACSESMSKGGGLRGSASEGGELFSCGAAMSEGVELRACSASEGRFGSEHRQASDIQASDGQASDGQLPGSGPSSRLESSPRMDASVSHAMGRSSGGRRGSSGLTDEDGLVECVDTEVPDEEDWEEEEAGGAQTGEGESRGDGSGSGVGGRRGQATSRGGEMAKTSSGSQAAQGSRKRSRAAFAATNSLAATSADGDESGGGQPAQSLVMSVHAASQMTEGVEPPPRARRRRRV